MFSQLKFVVAVLAFAQFICQGNSESVRNNYCTPNVNNDGQTTFPFHGTGQCDYVPLTVPRNGFKFDLHLHSSPTFGAIGIIHLLFGNSIATVSLYFETSFKEFNVYNHYGDLLGETRDATITIEVHSDGKGYVLPQKDHATSITFPSLKELPMEGSDRGSLSMGLQWRDVATLVELQFHPEVKVHTKSAKSITAIGTLTNATANATAITTANAIVTANATATTTDNDQTADKTEPTTTGPHNNGTSEKTPYFKQTWFIVVAIVIVVFLLIVVAIIIIVGVKLIGRYRRKRRLSTTPRTTAGSQNTPGDIHISIDGYDLFVPGHPEERLEFKAANPQKKGAMLDDFMARRNQS
uniref:CUB domain-containing protein n=1 Tax=Panagrellus redivivus TaxID=6233 RepID=A0A7E4URB8_PANRE